MSVHTQDIIPIAEVYRRARTREDRRRQRAMQRRLDRQRGRSVLPLPVTWDAVEASYTDPDGGRAS